MKTHATTRRATLLLAAVLLGHLAGGGAEPESGRSTPPPRDREAGRNHEGGVKLAPLPDGDAGCSTFCIARDIPIYVPPNRGSIPMRIGGASRGA